MALGPRTRLELLEVFRRPPRQLDVGRNCVEKSSRPSSFMLRLPGTHRVQPLPAYKKSGEARCANPTQQVLTPFSDEAPVTGGPFPLLRG